jgi:hypothetical protein
VRAAVSAELPITLGDAMLEKGRAGQVQHKAKAMGNKEDSDHGTEDLDAWMKQLSKREVRLPRDGRGDVA